MSPLLLLLVMSALAPVAPRGVANTKDPSHVTSNVHHQSTSPHTATSGLEEAMEALVDTPLTFARKTKAKSSRPHHLTRGQGARKTVGARGGAIDLLAGLDRVLDIVGEKSELEGVREAMDTVAEAMKVVEEEGELEEAWRRLVVAETKLEGIANGLEPVAPGDLEAADNMVRFFKVGERPRRSVAGEGRRRRRSVEGNELGAEDFYWLEENYGVTREEVAHLQVLPDEEFQAIMAELGHNQEGYSLDGLVDLLRSARSLVPGEVQAAAAGVAEVFLQVGRRLSARARPAYHQVKETTGEILHRAKPAYTMVRAATGELLQQARDAVPDDVADWTAEGGELAAAYLGAGAGYLGEYLEPEYLEPRLDQLLLTLARVRAQLGAAGSGAAQAAVPALQAVAQDLEETVLLAREAVAPVAARVGEGWEDVREHPVARKVSGSVSSVVSPVSEGISHLYTAYSPSVEQGYDTVVEKSKSGAAKLGHTLRHKVAPAVKHGVKRLLHRVFTGVPRLVSTISQETHHAAKVFQGKYADTLKKMRSEERDPEPNL